MLKYTIKYLTFPSQAILVTTRLTLYKYLTIIFICIISYINNVLITYGQ